MFLKAHFVSEETFDTYERCKYSLFCRVFGTMAHSFCRSQHPSPLSVHRGFFGNKHFSLANEWLEQKYGPTGKVDWCNLEPKPVEDETPTPSQSQEQDARSSPVPDPEDGDVAAA
jgi:hypothetical protein